MKKALLCCLCLALLFCLLFAVGCKKDKDDTPATDPTTDTPTTPPEPSRYSVTFKDENGNTLSSENLSEGTVPTYTYTPADTAEWAYTMEGWATAPGGTPLASLPAVTENVTYYAVVSAQKRAYMVTFDSNGGSTVNSQTVLYGDTAAEPPKPTREGYRFAGWVDASGAAVSFPLTVTGNVTLKAVWNEVVDVKAYLAALTAAYELNPYSYIPEALRPGATIISAGEIITDYSSFVNKNSIRHGGFGEQWNMIAENLNQTSYFFTALNSVDSVVSASVAAFNNYIDSNPADAAHYETKIGDYDVTITFRDGILFYVLSFDMGAIHPEIMMTYEPDTQKKTVRIQMTDANALKYEITENSYTLALRYLGVRRTYFRVERDENGRVEGNIAEYLGIDGKVSTSSAAQFFISDGYASVVGNKASGIPGFSGYINELYSTDSGRMLGYEVRETLSSITYNTLWFNLDDITGIDSYREVTADDKTTRYINGLSDAFVAKKVGGFSLKSLSRRFDIELRTQYYYVPAEDGSFEKVEVKVPMLFVQAEQYESFVADMKSANNVTVSVSAPHLSYLQAEYAVRVDAFIEMKDSITVDFILGYIGTSYTA